MEPAQVVAVVGATASGKSAYAVELAARVGGEIVSCDSMQVYRGMEIGTAQPTPAEMGGVRHHLIGFADPCVPFSVADYVVAAEQAVKSVLARGKIPVLCGGTGLYLDRFLMGGVTPEAETDAGLREELFSFAAVHGNEALHTLLRDVDPESAAQIHPNNVRRVVRALEIYRLTKVPKSEWDRRSRTAGERYRATVIGLDRPREDLYRRIDARAERMMAAGLCEEAERLRADGVFEKNATAAQAIGYKEILPYLAGRITRADALEALKTATRRYAKRQLTWFRGRGYVRWYAADDLPKEIETWTFPT